MVCRYTSILSTKVMLWRGTDEIQEWPGTEDPPGVHVAVAAGVDGCHV